MCIVYKSYIIKSQYANETQQQNHSPEAKAARGSEGQPRLRGAVRAEPLAQISCVGALVLYNAEALCPCSHIETSTNALVVIWSLYPAWDEVVCRSVYLILIKFDGL